jgi:hypothetical protein
MRRFSVVACLLGVALMVATPARASEISFVSQDINIGDTFDVDVVLSGNAATLLSYAFDLSFDSSILAFITAVNGSLFPDDGFFAAVDSGVGTIMNIPISGTVTGNGVLAKVTFTSIAGGDSLLSIFNASLTDDNLLTDPNAPLIFPDVIGGTINVSSPNPVPEPSTLGLVGLGLFSLARRLRRRPAAN